MTADEALLNAGCCSLPTDLGKVAAAHGIKIISYESYMKAYETDIDEVYRSISHLGFSFCEGGHYICAINEKACGRMRRRWTTAHELAHILLGHIRESGDTPPRGCEYDADKFAAQLIAPMCVIHMCGISTAQELARATGLSRQASEIRMNELSALRARQCEELRSAARSGAELYQSDVFFPDEASQRLLRQYLPFISQYITRKAAGRYPAYLPQR
ncbi:MAG: ImmA/IrrE family metallo-endopeptidase [Oscillospiraceae bacterium]